jgi:hypothetical protein
MGNSTEVWVGRKRTLSCKHVLDSLSWGTSKQGLTAVHVVILVPGSLVLVTWSMQVLVLVSGEDTKDLCSASCGYTP